MSSAQELLQNGLKIGIGLVMMCRTSVELTTMVVCVAPVFAVLSSAVGTHVRGLSKEHRAAEAAAAGVAHEGMAGIRTVKLFGKQAAICSKYSAQLQVSEQIAVLEAVQRPSWKGLNMCLASIGAYFRQQRYCDSW